MSQYLLDTNIVSYIIKGHTAVRRRLVGVPMYELAISAVTEGELRYGVARLPSAARLNTMVEEYGRVRSALERAGGALGNLDTMIAAHALATGSVLVTHDKAFARVKGLKIVDWTKL